MLKKSSSPFVFVLQERTWAPSKLTVAEASPLCWRRIWGIPFLSLKISTTPRWRGFLSLFAGDDGDPLRDGDPSPALEEEPEVFISNFLMKQETLLSITLLSIYVWVSEQGTLKWRKRVKSHGVGMTLYIIFWELWN